MSREDGGGGVREGVQAAMPLRKQLSDQGNSGSAKATAKGVCYPQ